MEDRTVRRLTKKIFPHLWVRHKLMSSVPSRSIFPFNEMTVFAQGIGNAVIVYLHMYRPTLSNYLEKHIPSMQRSKRYFWTHVAFLCLQARLTNDNVFDYFLTTCAITAEVALHCYMNGFDDVLPLASAFFCAFFENELYNGFHKTGGWKGLQQYIEDTSCKELYELVDGYVTDLDSPSDHLPILISIRYEQLAAGRREKFMSLLSFKIGEVQRDDKTTVLVSGIYHWYFMENHRVLVNKPGILKRMVDVRHKWYKLRISMDEGKRDQSTETDETLDGDSEVFNAFELLPMHNETQPSESINTVSETRFNNKIMKSMDDSKCTKMSNESKPQLRSKNEAPNKTEFGSSYNLSELRSFYENLSASSESKIDNSKNFRINNEASKGLKTSDIKELDNQNGKIDDIESYPRSVPNSSKNNGNMQKLKNFMSSATVQSTETSNHADALSDFTKSFQELGFECLFAGDSSFDEKYRNFANHAEVMEKCRYFQNKYPSIQFAILLPSEISHTSQKEKHDDVLSKNSCNERHFSNVTKDLDDGHDLLLNCATENNSKLSSAVVKVKENDLSLKEKKDKTNLLEPEPSEPATESRYTVTKVNENQLKDETRKLKNLTNETIKISRFTVSKVLENQSKDRSSILGENMTVETTKLSRFTVSKVDERSDGTNVLGKNWGDRTTKISRFTVSKVDERKDGTNLLGKNCKDGMTKISRFTVKKVEEHETVVDDIENETVHFEENGNVKYQKRVSFAEHPMISYYNTYSSDDSYNSTASERSPNKNSPKRLSSSKNYKLNHPPRNPPNSLRRNLFQRSSSVESPSSSNNAESSNMSSAFGFFNNLFKRSTRNSKAVETPKESKGEKDHRHREESRASLAATSAMYSNPAVFRV